MDPTSILAPSLGLAEARTAYGRGTAVWSAPGLLHVDEDWWIALSRAPYFDYNLALIHGEHGADAVPQVLDEVKNAHVPAVIMLAGAGLRAASALADAGWVCTGALPFMGKERGPLHDDLDVRLLEQRDLTQARALTSSAFGVAEAVGAIVYAEDALERECTRFWGLFEEDVLRCCSVSQYVDGRYSVGWALATAPERQRAGYGRRLMRASAARRMADGIPVSLLMATEEGRHLYEQEGYTTLEYWQIWSRARWVLP